MAAEPSTNIDNVVNASTLPWIGVVPVGADDLGILADFLHTLVRQAVLPSFHVCLVTEDSLAGQIHIELKKAGAISDVSVFSAAAVPDLVSAISLVAGKFPRHDVILLAVGAILPFAWDARLRKAAHAEVNIAASTAMCDFAPMFALVETPVPAGVASDTLLIDRTAYAMGNRSYYDVPRIHQVCTYFRRDALDTLSGTTTWQRREVGNSLGLLTKRLRASGWSCVLCDFLYVGTRNQTKDSPTTDDVEENAFRQHHPLGALRRSVAAALREGISGVSVPGLDERPVQLHIMHFWGGGLDKWVRDFSRADTGRINLVFSSFRIGDSGGQRLVLYSDPVDPNPIRVWDIAQPIRSTLSSNIEYRQILEQIIREFEVEAIIVSSLIGHTLDAVNQPIKTLVVCHDFYPVCQAINPQFGKTCERCNLEDLRTCARSNPLNNIFVDQTSDDWHAMRTLYIDRLVANNIDLVAPSPSVVNTFKRISPGMEKLNFHVIPHGIDMNVEPLPIATRNSGEPLRLVVLGRLSVQKGTELLRAACERLRPFSEIMLLGCGGNGIKLAKDCGWKYIEKFEPAELPAILREFAPHAGVLSSVIPETFSYTLSELNCLGIPALATNLGSFADRITNGDTGFLYDPTADGLVSLVRRLHAEPELLRAAAQKLHTTTHHRSVAEMVHDYRELVPAVSRPIARFRVGIGTQSGLTEPYRHLSEAYAHLSGAYEHTKLSYENTRIERDCLATVFNACEQWANDIDALNVGKRWWRIRAAMLRTDEFREVLRKLEHDRKKTP